MLMSDLVGGKFKEDCTFIGRSDSRDIKKAGVVWPYREDFDKINDKLEKVGVTFKDIHNLVGIYDERKWMLYQIKHGIRGQTIDIDEVVI